MISAVLMADGETFHIVDESGRRHTKKPAILIIFQAREIS